jgi:hypothetical protein
MVVTGRAMTDGLPAHGSVYAVVNGVECGEARAGSQGQFEIRIHLERPDSYHGCVLGSEVHFQLDGLTATEHVTLQQIGAKNPVRLDLSFVQP